MSELGNSSQGLLNAIESNDDGSLKTQQVTASESGLSDNHITDDAKVKVGAKKILSPQEARSIFLHKYDTGIKSWTRNSVILAAKYKITPKAIRDIWNGRSWLDTTSSLWRQEDRVNIPTRRRTGRPRGSLDTKPRRRKTKFVDESQTDESEQVEDVPVRNMSTQSITDERNGPFSSAIIHASNVRQNPPSLSEDREPLTFCPTFSNLPSFDMNSTERATYRTANLTRNFAFDTNHLAETDASSPWKTKPLPGSSTSMSSQAVAHPWERFDTQFNHGLSNSPRSKLRLPEGNVACQWSRMMYASAANPQGRDLDHHCLAGPGACSAILTSSSFQSPAGHRQHFSQATTPLMSSPFSTSTFNRDPPSGFAPLPQTFLPYAYNALFQSTGTFPGPASYGHHL